MSYFDRIETKEIALLNPVTHEEVVSLALGGNNDKPQRSGRLQLRWARDYSSEIEIEPGPDCKGSPGNSIISQIMQWGMTTPDGTGRGRVDVTIAVDGQGGQYGIIGSTTNDPSNSVGQKRAMPLILNAGEGKGMYYIFYPSDNTIMMQDRNAGIDTGRMTFARLIRHLRRIGK